MPKPKKPTPKNLYVRQLTSGAISVGEYLNAKWRNVQDPFDCEDAEAVRKLNSDIQLYKSRENREVEFVPYQGNTEAVKLLNDAIKKYCHDKATN